MKMDQDFIETLYFIDKDAIDWLDKERCQRATDNDYRERYSRDYMFATYLALQGDAFMYVYCIQRL